MDSRNGIMRKLIIILMPIVMVLFLGAIPKRIMVHNLYESSTTLTDSLVAYYPFNGNANDESGNGYNGSVTGATLTTDRDGNANSAYQFGGSGKYISVPMSMNGFTVYTISAWYLQVTDDGLFPPIYCSGSGFADRKPWVYKNSANNLFINDIRKISASNYALISDAEPDVSNWTHIVATWTGTLSEIWINGVKDINDLTTPSFTLDYSGTAYIGKDISNNIYCGTNDKIDDLLIYNRVLTTDEITALYNE